MQAATQVALHPSLACQAAVGVVRRLREANHSAYLVGGCVRDLLLGLDPKDYDIATQARPQQVKRLFRQVIEVGVAFGVVRVRAQDSEGGWHEVEVATFRADGEYLDGRRPGSVRFTDAREDVLRRDFTINGLLLDPLSGATHGVVVDWVGGLADLQAGRLRAIGDPRQRFAEDALRLLRAPRFAARFGLQVDPATADAIAELAATLRKVAVERITAELAAMLTADSAPQALELLSNLGLAAVLWPGLCAVDSGLQAPQRRARLLLADAAGSRRPGLDLALAVASLGADVAGWLHTAELEQSFRLSRADRSAIAGLETLLSSCLALQDPRGGPWRAAEARWLRHERAADALALLEVTDGNPRWRQWRTCLGAAQPQWLHPAPLVDGDQLKAAGFSPGPQFKEALLAAEDAALEGGGRQQAWSAALAVLSRRVQG